MDYKKIIKSRALRVRIMQILSFVPDSWMLRLQYRIKTGHQLDLKNPRRYTEKLQWYKLYYRDPLMAQCVDKYAVRTYVEQCGLHDILNPIYGVYDVPEQVRWEELPDRFVAKDTLGGGGNDVIICRDKSKLNRERFYAELSRWVTPVHGKHPGREWVYDNAKHRILIEKLIDSDPKEGGLIDYKFFCFNGKPEYLYVIADRKLGQDAEMGIFSREFCKLPVQRVGERKLERSVSKPINYEEMILCAEKLSGSFPHARVDLYNQDGKIIFGEITFFNASGYMMFDPDEFDLSMGDKFILPKEKYKMVSQNGLIL